MCDILNISKYHTMHYFFAMVSLQQKVLRGIEEALDGIHNEQIEKN